MEVAMSDAAVVPFRLNDRLLMGVVAVLILMVGVVVYQVEVIVTSGVRPQKSDIDGLVMFGGFMLTATGVLLPLARRFDVRHAARLRRISNGARTAWPRLVSKVRSIRLPFGR
ncbi:hypothetical protein D9602_11815 [Sphingomonas sp. TX0522]|nr:hypothetical protein [Sphingomonas sp. TX0522]